MIKSKKELEIILSKLYKINKPKLELEQYETPSDIASELIWYIYMNKNIEGKIIADLGSGNGIFGIGCLLLNSKFVYFVEKDKDLIDIIKKNLDLLGIKDKYEILNIDVEEFNENVDIIISNPPFGIQSKEFTKFYNKIIELKKKTYLIIHENKLEHFKNLNPKIISKRKMKIKKSYFFHEKEYYEIPILLIEIF